MPKRQADAKDDSKRTPKQPAQDGRTYPEGLERERQEPAGGYNKPRPSDSDNKR